MQKLQVETIKNSLMGDLWVGVVLQMLVQNWGPDMVSMVGRFPSLVHFIIQNLAQTAYTNEEDDIDARLVTFNRNLMIHSFRNLTLEDFEDEDERMEGCKSEYFRQNVRPSNKERQNLFGEWMDSIECLDGYAFDRPIDMEVDSESPDYMDEDPRMLPSLKP